MPYSRFIDLYKIKPDSFSEDDYYEGFLLHLRNDFTEPDKGPFDFDYNTFVNKLIDQYSVTTALDKDSYEIARKEANELVLPPSAF